MSGEAPQKDGHSQISVQPTRPRFQRPPRRLHGARLASLLVIGGIVLCLIVGNSSLLPGVRVSLAHSARRLVLLPASFTSAASLPQHRCLSGTAALDTATASLPPPAPPVQLPGRDQAQLVRQSSSYSEERVLCLRQLQEEAAAQLAAGKPPPAAGTAVFPPGSEDGECVGVGPAPAGALAAVVVITFDRARYLEHMLASLFSVHGRDPQNRRLFPLFVSQDGNATGVQDVVAQHLDRLSFLNHRELAPPVPKSKWENVGYYRIANHYKFILRTFFDCFQYERLLAVEDDLVLAPDFFSYFAATAPVLDDDPTLWCIVAWNEHGQDRYVSNATQLYRSDFFSTYGWMTVARVWDSLRDSWAEAYFDDWLRNNNTRRGRQCIMPEVCRVYNYGDVGTSGGDFFKRFLAPIKLNTEDVAWSKVDMRNMEAVAYHRRFEAELEAATELHSVEEAKAALAGMDYVLRYSSKRHYEDFANALGMLAEWRGVPRSSYAGAVVVRNTAGARVFIVPTPEVDFSVQFDPYDPRGRRLLWRTVQ